MSRVKFGDVVVRANTKEDRFNTDREFYVGGEHIDTGEFLITKRGIIKGSTIGPMFYFGFKSGQVLLASRSPDLRKAGMVTFDGICSEKTFVIESRDESVLLQSFLPVIVRSDAFWEFANDNQSGSVNHFINWTTFARYEFELPSINEQRRIADALWAMVDLRKKYEILLDRTDELVKSQFIEMFGNPVSNSKGWPTKPLKEVAPEYNPVIPDDDEYWWLNLDMIESNTGWLIEKVVAKPEEIGSSTSTFDDTMVLYSKLRPYLNKVIVPEGYGYATTELVGMRPDETILNKYFLFNLLRGDDFLKYANGLSAGGQMPRMPMKELRAFECILPPMDLQETFVRLYKQSDKSKFEIKQCIETTEKLLHRIIDESLN